MRLLRARTAVAVAAGLFALLPATGAWADTNASVDPAAVPASAKSATVLCEADFGGGPHSDQDVWVFALPSTSRHFVSIAANFDTDGDGTADASRVAPAYGGIADDSGTSKGWLPAPAGWVLIGATATVSGDPDADGVAFTLTHTCPASGTPSATPRPALPSPNPTVDSGLNPARTLAEATPRSTGQDGPPDTPLASSPAATTTSATSTGPKSSLGPETGAGGSQPPLGGLILGGGFLLAAAVGVGLLVMAFRRRDAI